MKRLDDVGGMTANDLLSELQTHLKTLFAHVALKTIKGDTAPPKIFIHGLPIPQDDYDAELTEIPYIIEQFVSSEVQNLDSGDEAKLIKILLIIGVYDPDPDRNGFYSLLNMMQRIENDFGQHRRIGNFKVESPIASVADDSDTHPYYFGAVTATFSAPRTVMEDPFA